MWLRCATLGMWAGASAVAALGTNYEHDGKTTFCWAIPRPTSWSNLTDADRTPAFSGRDDCPLEITITLSKDLIRPFDSINFTWTVSADFTRGNAINNTQLYVGLDPTRRAAQIVHSNVHSCVYGTGCDPFNDGKELVDKTVNKIANFTDNKAEFKDSLTFAKAGEYSVLAHIILPDQNESRRFDYAVYTKLVVAETAPAPTTTTPQPTTSPPMTAAPIQIETTKSDDGVSQEVVVGIIVGGIVIVVALIVVAIICRRRDNQQRYTQAPTMDSTMPKAADYRSHTESATFSDNPAGHSSAWATALDGTNHSSHSSESYTAPVYMRHSTIAQNTQNSMGNTHRQRVDSDVEL